MGLLNYIKRVRSISSDEFNKKFGKMKPDEFNLIDVRQPKEYSEKHIPGAVLVPLGELQSRLNEFDKSKPTVAY